VSIKLPDIVQKARVDLTDYRKSVAEAARLGKNLSKSLDDANKSTKELDKNTKTLSTDLDKADASQRRVTKSYKAHVSEVRRLNAQLNADVNRTLLNAAKSAESLNRATGDLGSTTKTVGSNFKAATNEASRFRQVISQMNKDRHTGVENFSSFLGNLVNELKVPAIAGGVQLLTASLSSLTAGGIALAGSLAPLVGLLGAMPGLLLAIKGPMVVIQAIFKPLSKASTAVADFGANSKQAQAAMKGLTTDQKSLAISLGGLKKGYQDLIKTAGSAALPGLAKAFGSLKGILPTFAPQFKALGKEIGTVGQKFAGIFTSRGGATQIRDILANEVKVFGHLGSGAANFGKTLLNVMHAARPLTLQLSKDFERLSGFILKSSGDGGRLTRFFALAYDVGKNLATAMVSIGTAIYNIGRIGTAVFGGARGITAGISGAAASLTEWTKSGPGIQAITKFFQDAKPVLGELGLLAKDLVKDFLSMSSNSGLAPLISLIRTELLPAVFSLVSGVGTELGPAIVNLATAFAKFLNILSFSPLLTMVGDFAKLAGAIADVASRVPLLSTGLATVLSVLLAIKGIKIVGEFSGISALLAAFKPGATGGLANFFGGLKTGQVQMVTLEKQLAGGGLAAEGFSNALGTAERSSVSFATRLGAGVRNGLAGNLAGVRQSFRLSGAEADRFASKLKMVAKIGAVIAVAVGGAALGKSLTTTTGSNDNVGLDSLQKKILGFAGTTDGALKDITTTMGTFGQTTTNDYVTAFKQAFSPTLGDQVDNFSSGILSAIGVDIPSATKKGQEAYQKYSDGLAALVSSGHAKEAAVVFQQVRDGLIAKGIDPALIDAAFSSYTNAVDAAGTAAKDAANQTKTLDDSITALQGTMSGANDATSTLDAAIADAAANLKALHGGATKGGAGLNLMSQAGRDAQEKLKGIADAALGGVKAWTANGDSARLVAQRIQGAREAFITTARAAGIGVTAANDLADAYGLIPAAVKTSIQADPGPALAAIAAAKAAMQSLIGLGSSFVVGGSTQRSQVGGAQPTFPANPKPVVNFPLKTPPKASTPTFTAPSGSPFLGAKIQPPRAIGGPVRKGMLYKVGERGIEAFMPGANGMVMSNDRLRAAARAAAQQGPIVPGSHGARVSTTTIDNSRSYSVSVTGGGSNPHALADAIAVRLRGLDMIATGTSMGG
jgi:hypothetical protein